MKEILFRGKRKDNGEWAKGYLTDYNTIIEYDIEGFGKQHEVIPETVGRYRFTNKYNQKVFVGDWLERPQSSIFLKTKQRCLISEDTFGNIKIINLNAIDLRYFDINELIDFKVIGNKWDNPELLKEDK